MNKLYFLLGGIGGFAGGFLLAKKYYTQIKEEEMERQREYYEKHSTGETREDERENAGGSDSNSDDSSDVVDDDVEEDNRTPGERLREKLDARKDVEDIIRGHEYRTSEMEKKAAPVEVDDGPYVISPEEYAEESTYEEVQLTWYERDQVLTRDEWNDGEYDSKVVTDIEGTVGTDWVDRIGEFEEDTVYVRDPGMNIDYIITREDTAYEID